MTGAVRYERSSACDNEACNVSARAAAALDAVPSPRLSSAGGMAIGGAAAATAAVVMSMPDS
eukprot:128638-Chlamydomonas_euryale.AAC.1